MVIGSIRRVLVGGVAVTLAVGLAACGGGGDSGGAQAASEVTLYSDNPQWKDGFEKVSVDLKKLTGGTGITPLSIPSTSSYEQVIRSSITTPKTADIIKWWQGYRLQDLARTGSLTDLTEVWDEAEKKGWVNPALKDQFTYKGKVYGLPLSQSNWVVYYNKKLFAQLGLTPPKTWDEFLAACEKLKGAGAAPLWTGQTDGWTSFIPFEEFLSKSDPQFYQDVTSGKASYTDEKAKKALAVWKEMIDKGYTSKTDIKFLDTPAQLKAGKLAMIPLGTWFNGTLSGAGLKPGEDYGAFLWPSINPSAPKSVIVESGVFAIPSAAPHKDAAIKVMKSWMDPTVQATWTELLGDTSANPTVISKDPVLAEIAAEVKAMNPLLLTRYWEASPPALVEGNVQDLGKFMLKPEEADSVLADMQKRADTEWAAWRKAGG